MVEREEIMIVRKVYLMNSMPNIGAMFPQSEDNENVCIIIVINNILNYLNNIFVF